MPRAAQKTQARLVVLSKAQSCRILSWDLGFRVLGFRVSGFRVSGF